MTLLESTTTFEVLFAGIVCFRAWLFHHHFILKKCLKELREKGVFKLTLTSTRKQCEIIGCNIYMVIKILYMVKRNTIQIYKLI